VERYSTWQQGSRVRKTRVGKAWLKGEGEGKALWQLKMSSGSEVRYMHTTRAQRNLYMHTTMPLLEQWVKGLQVSLW
jgi:hypothetical protein